MPPFSRYFAPVLVPETGECVPLIVRGRLARPIVGCKNRNLLSYLKGLGGGNSQQSAQCRAEMGENPDMSSR
jgi:hypothetical protein